MVEQKNFGLASRQSGMGGERRSASVGYFPAWVLLASIVHSSVFSYSMVSY
jgi:hypothetical protein